MLCQTISQRSVIDIPIDETLGLWNAQLRLSEILRTHPLFCLFNLLSVVSSHALTATNCLQTLKPKEEEVKLVFPLSAKQNSMSVRIDVLYSFLILFFYRFFYSSKANKGRKQLVTFAIISVESLSTNIVKQKNIKSCTNLGKKNSFAPPFLCFKKHQSCHRRKF